MIRGIGVDISRVSRFDGMEGRLLARIFAPSEIAAAPSARSEYFASRFAAKEALAKALGTGIRGFSLPEIAVGENEDGKPFFVLSGRAREAAAGLRLHLSLSHEREYAVAMVVAEDEI